MKKGISLPLHRWKMLVVSLEYLDQALDEKREYATNLGGNVYSTVKAGGICEDLRQHWLPPNQTKVVPTKKGITLRPGEYVKLKDVASVICDCTRTEFGSTVSLQIGPHEPVGVLILSRMQPRSLCGMMNRL